MFLLRLLDLLLNVAFYSGLSLSQPVRASLLSHLFIHHLFASTKNAICVWCGRTWTADHSRENLGSQKKLAMLQPFDFLYLCFNFEKKPAGYFWSCIRLVIGYLFKVKIKLSKKIYFLLTSLLHLHTSVTKPMLEARQTLLSWIHSHDHCIGRIGILYTKFRVKLLVWKWTKEKYIDLWKFCDISRYRFNILIRKEFPS